MVGRLAAHAGETPHSLYQHLHISIGDITHPAGHWYLAECQHPPQSIDQHKASGGASLSPDALGQSPKSISTGAARITADNSAEDRLRRRASRLQVTAITARACRLGQLYRLEKLCSAPSSAGVNANPKRIANRIGGVRCRSSVRRRHASFWRCPGVLQLVL